MTPPPDGDRLDVDVRFLLANERSLLAWLRTALTLVAGGVALAQFVGDRTALPAAGVGLLVLGSVCGVTGYGPAGLTAGVVALAAILTAIYAYDQLS